MKDELQKHVFTYEENKIEFLHRGESVMVNATEMAKVFNRQVVAFLRNEDTKRFIAEALKSENSHFLGGRKRGRFSDFKAKIRNIHASDFGAQICGVVKSSFRTLGLHHY